MTTTVNRWWAIAVHESAHACAAFVLGRPIHSIRINHDGTGEFRSLPINFVVADQRRTVEAICSGWKKEGGPTDLEWVEHHCIGLLAGPCATERLAGAAAAHASGYMDLFMARCLLATLPLSDQQVAAKFDEVNERARQIVKNYWLPIRRLAGVVWCASRGEVFERQIREALHPLMSGGSF